MQDLTDADYDRIHTIDRLETELAKHRRAVTNALALLADVPHMVQHGRNVVAFEYLDRAQQTLEATR